MDCDLQILPLDRIALEDQFFKITSNDRIDDLVDSIGRFDLINPPYFFFRNDHWAVVSGFRRVSAVKQLQWKEMPARILRSGTPIETAVRIAIIENSSQRPLNVVEQARSLQLLSMTAGGSDRLVDQAKGCGLILNRKVADELSTVNRLPAWMQAGLIDGAIALPVVSRLFEMGDIKVVEALGKLLVSLNLSLNRQRELIDWIDAIAHRERMEIPQIIENESLRRILADDTSDPKQRANSVRDWLKRRRYPAITAVDLRFETIRKKLKLHPSIQMNPSPGFESPKVTFQALCASTQELCAAGDELRRIAADPEAPKLFEIMDLDIPPSTRL